MISGENRKNRSLSHSPQSRNKSGVSRTRRLETVSCCVKKNYSVQRRNSSEPLVPPNPKEFESAYSTFAFRA